MPHGLRHRAEDRRITAVMIALATLFGLMAAVLTATTIVVGSRVARFYASAAAQQAIAEEPR